MSMLNPENDRLDYGKILTPPGGYSLDFAVGTTYSLDLDALTGASIALGLSEDTDSKLLNNPVFVLEALRRTGDRIALFCQDGQISCPRMVSPLYMLLEKIVFGVTLPRRNRAYPSFHPKFWLIRYINDKNMEPLYRAIVLSRNLTFDRSWDVTISLEGKAGKEITDKNDPVIDFLGFLEKKIRKDENGKLKKKKIQKLMEELQYVNFSLDSKEFYDFDFIPMGIKKADGSYYSITDYRLYKNMDSDSYTVGLNEIFIMSPFLSSSTIKSFNSRGNSIKNKEYVLVTRKLELEKLKPSDVCNFKIYTMKDDVIDGETAFSGESQDYQKQDIHAKIYMDRKDSYSELFLGSMNASHNAVFSNVEFMIRLKSSNRYLNINRITEDIFCGPNDERNPFLLVSPDELGKKTVDEENDYLENTAKEISRLHPKAVVIPDGDKYDVIVSFGKYESPYKITITPLIVNIEEVLSEEIVFKGLSVTQLSDFYVVSVHDGDNTARRVLIIPTEGMPEDREKAVVSNIVKDKQTFFRYVSFLLGDNNLLSAVETGLLSEKGITNPVNRYVKTPSLYEKMLKTASESPERFKEVDYLLNSISNNAVVPQEFTDLFGTFKKVLKK